ncbi:FecR domain-containing protein [Pigmentiphaga sp.]|uniref:FecR domain-containing protein n=1 Tax=Pigmentiphaga sp. TaxID=1977564 RepID=UPI0025DC9557|nr:FecR domain-containing protein [Pigmentiphaga sp.]
MTAAGPAGAVSASRLLALREAAQWHAQLCAGPQDAAQRERWAQWRDGNADNKWAWGQLERLQRRLGSVPGKMSAAALDLAGSRASRRRAMLRGLGGLAMLGGGLLMARRPVFSGADYQAAKGEIRPLVLEDGTRLVLDSQAAVDARFDATQRLVWLRAGNVLVETAADPARRPFRVGTVHGLATSVGTRYTVRLEARATRVAVLEHAVLLHPARASAPPRLIQAGQEAVMSAWEVEAVAQADPTRALWAKGVLVVSDWALGDVVAELARYRPGWLGCDPAAAGHRVSGSFPLNDSDAALAALRRTFPVEIQRRTRYWTRIVRR